MASSEDLILPKLVVFDLDFTVWHPEMYELSGGAPFKRCEKTGKVTDRRGTQIHIFEGALHALKQIQEEQHLQGISVGYASRTFYGEWAQECLELLRVDGHGSLLSVSHYQEIYPGDKKAHFASFKKDSGLEYEDMLFFDNERRNCSSVNELGVTTVCTPDGMGVGDWSRGLEMYHAAALRRQGRGGRSGRR